MTNERAIQILENLISINGDVIIGDEGREALEMAIRSLQQEQQEQPDKSLEEAAEEYIKKGKYLPEAFVVRPAFIAGAEWQKEQDTRDMVMSDNRHFNKVYELGKKDMKEQMMKEAYVESQIVEDGRIELEGDPLPCLNPIILLPYPQFEPGDKVRIVVLKAEEE